MVVGIAFWLPVSQNPWKMRLEHRKRKEGIILSIWFCPKSGLEDKWRCFYLHDFYWISKCDISNNSGRISADKAFTVEYKFPPRRERGALCRCPNYGRKIELGPQGGVEDEEEDQERLEGRDGGWWRGQPLLRVRAWESKLIIGETLRFGFRHSNPCLV